MNTFLPEIKERKSYQREPEHKCPFCYTRLNKKRALFGWNHIKRWFLKNRDLVAQQVILHELHHHPEIELNPDLLYALKAEAGCDGLEVCDLLNEIVDSYFVGKFNRIRRRKERRKRVLQSKKRGQ